MDGLFSYLADLRLNPEDALVGGRSQVDRPVVQARVLGHSYVLLPFLQRSRQPV